MTKFGDEGERPTLLTTEEAVLVGSNGLKLLGTLTLCGVEFLTKLLVELANGLDATQDASTLQSREHTSAEDISLWDTMKTRLEPGSIVEFSRSEGRLESQKGRTGCEHGGDHDVDDLRERLHDGDEGRSHCDRSSDSGGDARQDANETEDLPSDANHTETQTDETTDSDDADTGKLTDGLGNRRNGEYERLQRVLELVAQ